MLKKEGISEVLKKEKKEGTSLVKGSSTCSDKNKVLQKCSE